MGFTTTNVTPGVAENLRLGVVSGRGAILGGKH